MHIKLKKIILLLGDIILLYASLLLMFSLSMGGGIGSRSFIEHLWGFTGLFLIWELVFYIWNLYKLDLDSYLGPYIKAIVLNVLIGIVYFYSAPFVSITPKTNLLLVALFFTLFFAVWRALAFRLLNLMRPYYRVVLLGIDEHIESLASRIIEKRGSNYELSACINIDRQSHTEGRREAEQAGSPHEYSSFLAELSEAGVRVESDISAIEEFRSSAQPVKVVVSDRLYPHILEELYRYLNDKLSFYFVANFWEEAEEQIPVYATNELWFLDNLRNIGKGEYEFFKKVLDKIAALLFSPFFALAYIFAGAAIKLNSRGPVMFTQRRVGKNGSEFTLFKFRTMRADAEKDGKARWATEGDSRITFVGKILRRSRLDELPQILNILRGEMSLIGPRPERPEFVGPLAERIPHYNLRHLVRPGLTGWAQVHYEYASSEEETAIKLSYDLYYVKNRSLILDIKIALKTVLVVLERRGR